MLQCHYHQQKSYTCTDLPWGSLLQNTKGYHKQWIRTLHGTKRHRRWCLDLPMIIVNTLSMTWHCSLAGSWPFGQLFPWIHRGDRANRRTIYQHQGLQKITNRISVLSAPSYLDLVQYPHCTQIVTIKVQFQHSTFGPYAFHLASQCKSTRVFKYQNPKSE